MNELESYKQRVREVLDKKFTSGRNNFVDLPALYKALDIRTNDDEIILILRRVPPQSIILYTGYTTMIVKTFWYRYVVVSAAAPIQAFSTVEDAWAAFKKALPLDTFSPEDFYSATAVR